MTFIWVHMLWLLLLVPVIVMIYFLLLRRRKNSAARYSGLSMVREAMAGSSRWYRHLPPLLFLVSLTLLLLAVARPAAVIMLPSQRGTVVLAMDISGSMRATDIQPSRIAAAQIAAREFVSQQPQKHPNRSCRIRQYRHPCPGSHPEP